MNEHVERLAASNLVPQIYRALEPAYPHEGCGFIFLDGDRLVHVLAENRAQELHEKDPERYPRSASDWFEPDMRPWLQAERKGLVPAVIYHSHPDADAHFSDSDQASAVMVVGDGLVLERNPGVLHLVVSVRNGLAVRAKLYQFNDDSAVFDPVAEYDEGGLPISSK